MPCRMCFSSSLICLLVITCHGSVVNAYDPDLEPRQEDTASRFYDTSHISNENITGHNKSSSEISFSRSHKKDLNENFTSPILREQNNGLEKSNRISKRNSIRKSRNVDADFSLPLPIHSNHADHSIQPKPSTLSNGHLHSLHHNNESDSVHEHSHLEHHGPSQHGRSELDGLPENGSSHKHEKEYAGSSRKPSNKVKHSHAAGNGMRELQSGQESPCGNGHVHEEVDDHHDHDYDKPAADFHQHYPPSAQHISGRVWLYASLAVVVISLCGLISVAVIPIMQKWFYHTLLQFLVGLAIGSLSGDGLLHLMPHAILDGEGTHDHSQGNGHHHTSGLSMSSMEMKAIWKGLAALCGIFLFFVAERLLGALAAHRRQKKEDKMSRLPKNRSPVGDGANNGSVGEKLAQPKKNSYDHIKEKDEKETIQMLQTEGSPSKKAGSSHSIHEVGFHGRSSFSLEPEMTVAYRPDSDSSVIVSEHHGHNHGHSHELPQSVSAVAWMVIMGDGLHNFCDGLAIGAAFASGEADGISTTVAVFCHELPHELGDFAMLLKTGMKVRQALFYNGLSSILCFVGMVIGVSLGNVQSATNWVFAGTAGMFLYIALVDMLPELTSPSNTPGPAALSTLFVQFLGISIGISVMLLIALYEHELHSIVS